MLLLNGISMGMFAAPNRAAVMNSLPAADRGAGGGMNQTFQNSAQVLSIGIFFTLLIFGLASSLPAAMVSGLQAHGLSAAAAQRVGPRAADLDSLRRFPRLQPDPAPGRLRRRSGALSAHAQALLTGPAFFPHLISAAFRDGLDTAFVFAIVACLVAAAASMLRGGRYRHDEEPTPAASLALSWAATSSESSSGASSGRAP